MQRKWLEGYSIGLPEDIQQEGPPIEWNEAFAAGKIDDPSWMICYLQELVEMGPAVVNALPPAKYALLTFYIELGYVYHGARQMH